ncbi:MAG: histone deacetylase family protein [Azospirillaceae bacterium]
MHTALFTHAACIDHDTGHGHPERPDRLKAVARALEAEEFTFLGRHEAPRATPEQIARAHPRSHVDHVLGAIPKNGHRSLDPDTILSPGSGEAALRAAGAVCAAVDAVFCGDSEPEGARNAFCAVRPPGHHAEAARAMGFCLFNNAAIGAFHARAAHGIRRVAVIDFDVHHGNGTQDIFWDDPALFYASTHQSPFYPGTGAASERGAADNILNVPLHARAGSPEFRHAMGETVLPALEAFAPELLIVSAGFDAHRADPLAQLDLSEADFAWATRKLCELAGRVCEGRLVSTLEGGYDLDALASCTAVHVRELMAG